MALLSVFGLAVLKGFPFVIVAKKLDHSYASRYIPIVMFESRTNEEHPNCLVPSSLLKEHDLRRIM